MNREQALTLLGEYGERLEESEAELSEDLKHVMGMRERFPEDGSARKAMRWLGFAQGVLFANSEWTLEELKEHSAAVVLQDNVPRRVIIESPYAGDVEANTDYARDCLRDCLLRGESPYASHLLYTQPGVLNDDIPEERDLGIQAGFAWRACVHATVVYTDLGISRGMALGIADAERRGCTIEYRQLDDWADAREAAAQEGVA